METKIIKLRDDAPFSLKFQALNESGDPMDKAGSLVVKPPVTNDKETGKPIDQIATATVTGDSDIVDFVLTGKAGSQHFTVSDGVASAHATITVKSTTESDAVLTEVGAVLNPLPTSQPLTSNPPVITPPPFTTAAPGFIPKPQP